MSGSEKISVRRQCELLKVCRSMVYYLPRGKSEENLRLMREIDELPMEDASAEARGLRDDLRRGDWPKISRGRVKRLKGLDIVRPNQVWCADITYIPVSRGCMYLFCVMDWHSRKVLSWELSNTLDTDFCLRGLEKAVEAAGAVPEIFNTDQGCQFTSGEWTGRLEELGITISMDGRGRWLDNVVIERFWRSIKHEDIYLRSYENAWELERGIEAYIMRYKLWRPHQSLEKATPEEIYTGTVKLAA